MIANIITFVAICAVLYGVYLLVSALNSYSLNLLDVVSKRPLIGLIIMVVIVVATFISAVFILNNVSPDAANFSVDMVYNEGENK